MIYDSLDQLSRYTGLSRSLDAAVKAITSADLFALPAGRHELVPDMVYAVVKAFGGGGSRSPPGLFGHPNRPGRLGTNRRFLS